MLHVLPRLKQRDVKLGILMDGDRVVFSIRAGDQSQLAPLLFCRKLLLLIARLDAAVLGQNPNLEQMGRIRLGGIRLTVANPGARAHTRSEEHTSELQSLAYLVCRLLLEKKKTR